MTNELFSLGRIVATPRALALMEEQGIEPFELLSRHVRGDWGDLEEEDKRANDEALQDGSRILSAYGKGATKLWIITEADRSATTFLRPDEY